MNMYEFVFITKEGAKDVLKNTEDLIVSFKGKVAKKEEWGKKPFTYKIQGLSSGMYYIWDIELAGTAISPLKTKLNLEEGIIRYLLLRKE